ncbi:hypothetical protein [Cryobacterium sp. Y57]|uniref:hypothetical protein n=1 Tax=Cryobacterium sp. Y57 TaxID=2048287 RepID=UPI000CE33D33|nr:hypothetical protein [Cryobacterium sp. Y57]
MRRYVPGTWFGVVTDAGIAVLPGDIDPALLERIFTDLTAGHGLSALLDALTAEFGTGLASLPAFAIVTFVGDEARLAVRGPLAVTAEGDAEQGHLRVSGTRVTTWSESVSVTPGSIAVETDAATPHVDFAPSADSASTSAGESLPIVAGVVLCSSLVITLRPDAQAHSGELAASARGAGVGGTETDVADSGGSDSNYTDSSNLVAAADPGVTPPPAVRDVPERIVTSTTTDLPHVSRLVPTVLPPLPETALDHAEHTIHMEADSNNETLAVPEFTQGRDYDGLWGADAAVPEKPAAGAPGSAAQTSAAQTSARPITTMHATAMHTTAETRTQIDPEINPDLHTEIDPEINPDLHTEIDPDHDGETLSLEQLRALGLAAPAASVLAGVPAWAGVPALRYGRLLVSGGTEVVLDRSAVIGRKPSAARFTADRMPHLVTVPSPQQDISRSHLEVRCEG